MDPSVNYFDYLVDIGNTRKQQKIPPTTEINNYIYVCINIYI